MLQLEENRAFNSFEKLKSKDFARLRKQGTVYKTQDFIFVYEETCGVTSRLNYGFTVTKKIGNACKRNRIKRLIRESLRQYFKNPDLNLIKSKQNLSVNIISLQSSKDHFSSIKCTDVYIQVQKFYSKFFE